VATIGLSKKRKNDEDKRFGYMTKEHYELMWAA
jgi:hypothetical protein